MHLYSLWKGIQKYILYNVKFLWNSFYSKYIQLYVFNYQNEGDFYPVFVSK